LGGSRDDRGRGGGGAAADRARPARCDRDRARGRAAGGRRRDRRQGRGHRDGTGGPPCAVRRPPGRARGARVIPVELDAVERYGRVVARPWAEAVTGVQIDSRRIAEGDLFVAVSSGSDFVDHALARGAAAALVPEDAPAALAGIAAIVRERSQARYVAITGSTGKTSTKDILFAMCAPHVRTLANEGNYNNELGVPLTLCRVERDTELCIAELGMRGLGQIATLTALVDPDGGVITNVGPVHLEPVEFSKLREEEPPLPGGGLLLNDCYNANPVSMRAALRHLDERAGAHRRLAVLGEMAELGADAPAYHAEVGELVRSIGVQVIAVG